MAGIIQKVEKLQYKTIEIPKLTRGIAKDSTELILNKSSQKETAAFGG